MKAGTNIFCNLLLAGCLLTTGDVAASAALFEGDEALAVTLAGPLQQVLRDRAETPEYRSFRLEHGGIEVGVEVQARGSSRREACRFPPLRLRFTNPDPRSVFAGQSTIKLVTHCNRGARAEQNALEEYAAYRILNVLTPASYRVRLLRLTYVDQARPRARQASNWGFIIEDTDALARRLGGEHVEPDYVKASELDVEHASLIGLFQYLIGNTDYALNSRRPDRACCHNAKLIRLHEGLISVPYDFDQAGIVDAAYAGPNPVYHARDVRTRRYVGVCSAPEDLAAAFDRIVDLRAQVMAVLQNVAGMSETTRRRAKAYLELFYKRLDRSDMNRLLRTCRG